MHVLLIALCGASLLFAVAEAGVCTATDPVSGLVNDFSPLMRRYVCVHMCMVFFLYAFKCL